jgi:hypothetical protein
LNNVYEIILILENNFIKFKKEFLVVKSFKYSNNKEFTPVSKKDKLTKPNLITWNISAIIIKPIIKKKGK